jgi:hypothetical protein
MPTEFTLPDRSTVTLVALHAYRDRHAAEADRLEAARAESASQQADGVDEASVRLHARAVEIAGRNSDADAYAAALEQAERETAHDLTLGANYSATLNMIGSMHSAHSQRNSTFPERSATTLCRSN